MSQAQEEATELLHKVIGLRPDGEERPEQALMVKEVASCLSDRKNALLQAGTGVGKSLGYLIPAATSGKKVVVSTATKQLSEQIAKIDLPLLDGVMKQETGLPLNYALVKGRSNYVCLRKIHENRRLEDSAPGSDEVSGSDQGALIPDAADSPKRAEAKLRGAEMGKIMKWSERNDITGDRTDAPVVSDETWKDVSSTSNECPGKSACPFGEECFAEITRNKARVADIVVTNHALVGADLAEEPGAIYGERDVVIFDEVHEADSYLSSAWGVEMSVKTVEEAARTSRRHLLTASEDDPNIKKLEEYAAELELALENTEDGKADNVWKKKILPALNGIAATATRITSSRKVIQLSGGLESEKMKAKAVTQALDSLSGACYMLTQDSDDLVRWLETSNKRKVLKSAPLRIGPLLMERLQSANMTMIGTSATITVKNSFDIPVHNFAFDESAWEYSTLDVGTPFNYQRQGILYVPAESAFPAPVGKDRIEHSAAVLDELVEMVQAAGGRTLALSSTSYGARKMAERLRDTIDTPVISQFDGPAGVVTRQFLEDVDSTLCATMGMWQGLNIPGESLTLVVIDKIPFAPMNDPLMSSRLDDAKARGRNGFMDVYVADAMQKLAQGAGRLIRSKSDRGVVAILDTRLRSKSYGVAMRKGLPPFWLTDNKEQVLSSLENLSAK